jgi:DNA-binding NtrC family response regulator
MKSVLVIDDEEMATWAFKEFLNSSGYRPLIANTAERGLEVVRRERPDIVICDVRLPGMSGLEALAEIRRERPEAFVIVMTAYGTAQTAIEAIQNGAYDYLTKPLDLRRLRAILERIEQSCALRAEHAPEAMDPQPMSSPSVELVGESPAMQEIYKLIGMLTTNRVTVLIEGESGTGKELVARAIHFNSASRSRPFVAVNCGALTESLLESELFGHERGSFTDATRLAVGKIEAADDGTLFLDEIANTSLALQVKLLRALQEREFQRVGGVKTLPVRARVIAATNVPLEDAVRAGTFREDLYYRLKVVSMNLPPLRERRSDIPLLVSLFLKRISAELDRPARTVDETAMAILMRHDWRGNVRELENALRRAAVFSRGEAILPEHLPPDVLSPTQSSLSPRPGALTTTLRALADRAASGGVYHEVQNRVDRELLEYALEKAQRNQVRAAQWLGISRTTLRRRMEELGIAFGEDELEAQRGNV